MLKSPYPDPLRARAAGGEAGSLRCIDARVVGSQQVYENRHCRSFTFSLLEYPITTTSLACTAEKEALLQANSQALRLQGCQNLKETKKGQTNERLDRGASCRPRCGNPQLSICTTFVNLPSQPVKRVSLQLLRIALPVSHRHPLWEQTTYKCYRVGMRDFTSALDQVFITMTRISSSTRSFYRGPRTA